MTQPPADSESLKDYVNAALQQWAYTIPFLADKHEKSQGVRIIYSVDNDVVSLFTNPALVAVPLAGDGRKHGYFQLFIDDDRAASIARGRVVGNYIFQALTQGKPLLIVPPLTFEFSELRDHVAKLAAGEHFKAQSQLQALKKELEAARNTGDRNALLELLQQKAPDLVHLIEGEVDGIADPTAELRRFSIIFRDCLVAGPNFLISQRLFDSTILSALNAEKGGLALEKELESYRVIWSDVLSSRREKLVKEKKVDRDIRALARIQLINRLLGKNTKLVHITGDSHVLEAGRRILPAGMTRSFTECYLRHPRAFLAEPGMLTIEEGAFSSDQDILRLQMTVGDLSEFSKWLIVFLAKFWQRDCGEIYDSVKNGSEAIAHNVETGEIGTTIEKFCVDFPHVVAEFRSTWDKFSSDLTLGYVKKMAESMPYMRSFSSYLTGSLAEVEEELSQVIDDSWRATFESATATSYGITRISSDATASSSVPYRIVPRSVPPVCLSIFTNTKLLIKEIIEADSLIDIGDTKYSTLFKLIEKEDDSGYLNSLVSAVLFAGEGRWILARILGERSFDRRNRSKSDFITGREAAYFCAVALRNSSRTTRDLDTAEQWLNVAEKIWRDDKPRRPADHEIFEIRFPIERTSLSQARESFRVFVNVDAEKAKGRATGRVVDVQQEFENLLMELHRSMSQEQKGEYDLWIFRILQRRLLVNILMLALMRKFREGQEFSDGVWSRIKKYHAELTSDFKGEFHPRIRDSYLYYAVLAASTAWIYGGKDQIVQDARTSLSDELIEQYSSAAYDGNRLRFLREIIDMYR